MRIFKVDIEANNVQLLQSIEPKKTTLDFRTFNCTPRTIDWGILDAYVWNPKIKPKNFYDYTLGVLICDEQALAVLDVVFEMSGEILPVQVERGPKLYLLNILECMNGLNYETTQWDYYSDGSKGRILKYGFHPERVMNESTLFKIPENGSTDIFCFADTKEPDDEFYHLYHKHNLTGLIFEELYNDNSPVKL